ncbi:MAG: PcfJ domain-containing protein [Bacteroidales bacterium]|nr:PcfJ domain-containing protein [Bacteroidales bacterium]
MRPRTKKERLLLELTKKLPPLTKAQEEYPRRHCFHSTGYYWKKGIVWCQCCGEEYPVTTSMLAVSLDVGSEVCPACGAKLHLKHAGNRKKAETERLLYSVATTFRGYQVFRTFECYRWNRRGEKTEYSCDEVFQNWIDENGRETILKKDYTRSPFHLRFNSNSEYSIGIHNGGSCGYYYSPDLFDITDNFFYPRTSVLPIVKRNGWDNAFLRLNGVNPAELMRSLLSSPEVETLAKTGQHKILQYYMTHGWCQQRRGHEFKKGRFFASVCICNRNNYIVNDAGLWYDLLEALEYLKLDTRNAHFVCPPDLKAAHDRYTRRMQRAKEQEELRRQREEAAKKEADYKAKKGCFLGVCFGNKSFRVTVLQSVAEFVEEGKAMHHCVYANEYFASDCLILSVRDTRNKRVATVELSLKNFKVVQCRAACNKRPERYSEIVKLVESHAEDFRKARKQKRKTA